MHFTKKPIRLLLILTISISTCLSMTACGEDAQETVSGIASVMTEEGVMLGATLYLTPGDIDWELRATATEGYDNIGVTDGLESFINVRTDADPDADIIGKMTNHNICEVLETSSDGEWYKIESGDVSGWVTTEYVKTGWEAEDIARANAGKRVKVTSDTANVMIEANEDSEVYTQISCNELYDVVDYSGDYTRILVDEEVGYVLSSNLEELYSLQTAVEYTPPKELVAQTTRGKLVNLAMQYLGGRYVWGGETLGVGVDCSGFTMKLYEQFGVHLTHYAQTQASEGRRISRDQLQKGDLVFYAKGGYIHHVAMYIGDGKVIHAQSANLGIRITSMDYATPYCYATYLD